MREDPNIVRGL